jgi:retron-type reverse transcriptase
MRREHHTVVSDASLRLQELDESIFLFSETSYGFRIEPLHTDVDRYSLIVELWDYYYCLYHSA